MSSPYLLRVPAEEDELDDIAVGAGQLAAIRAGECQDVLVERGEGVGVDGEDADVREAERGGHLVQCDCPRLCKCWPQSRHKQLLLRRTVSF